MKNRVSLLNKHRTLGTRAGVKAAAVRAVFLAVLAAAFFRVPCFASDAAVSDRTGEDKRLSGSLILEDPGEKTKYAGYEMSVGDVFSIGFIHSVNQSAVTDYFEIREDGIYGVKTVYYGFGAGVPTQLEEGQILTYGDDGSMILTGYEVKMDHLIYRVGTVSDHILTLQDGTEISLRDLCGRNARVGFRFEQE